MSTRQSEAAQWLAILSYLHARAGREVPDDVRLTLEEAMKPDPPAKPCTPPALVACKERP